MPRLVQGKKKKNCDCGFLNVTFLRRRVLASLMCLFVALDVLLKKYENSRFLKFNLLPEKGGRLDANTDICFSLASCSLW